MEIENLVEKAKSDVRGAAGCSERERKWLEASIDSYGSPNLRIRVMVLEGSGPRGIVIANYYMGTVQAFGADGEGLSRYSFDDEQIREWRLRCEDIAKLPSKRRNR
jgi:hypothetical protein